eukprot:4749380-Pyramimonas_sp.AAC.1
MCIRDRHTSHRLDGTTSATVPKALSGASSSEFELPISSGPVFHHHHHKLEGELEEEEEEREEEEEEEQEEEPLPSYLWWWWWWKTSPPLLATLGALLGVPARLFQKPSERSFESTRPNHRHSAPGLLDRSSVQAEKEEYRGRANMD